MMEEQQNRVATIGTRGSADTLVLVVTGVLVMVVVMMLRMLMMMVRMWVAVETPVWQR